MRARDYDPTIGQFISDDPLGSGGRQRQCPRVRGESAHGSYRSDWHRLQRRGQGSTGYLYQPSGPRAPDVFFNFEGNYNSEYDDIRRAAYEEESRERAKSG